MLYENRCCQKIQIKEEWFFSDFETKQSMVLCDFSFQKKTLLV